MIASRQQYSREVQQRPRPAAPVRDCLQAPDLAKDPSRPLGRQFGTKRPSVQIRLPRPQR